MRSWWKVGSKDFIMMLGLNETIDQLDIANSAC